MQKKNLRTTDGLPLYLGIAGTVLLLIYMILQSGPSQAYTESVLAKAGVSSFNPMTTYIGYLVSFLIYPGIFFILLLVSAGKPRRGAAFAIVWTVISAIEIVSSLYSMVKPSELKTIAAAMVPGGFYLYALLGLLGNLCVLAACAVFLKRLHTPPQVLPAEEFSAQNGGNPPKNQ